MRFSGMAMAQIKAATPKTGTNKNTKTQNFPTVVLRASEPARTSKVSDCDSRRIDFNLPFHLKHGSAS
jgi:hypothetical protein